MLGEFSLHLRLILTANSSLQRQRQMSPQRDSMAETSVRSRPAAEPSETTALIREPESPSNSNGTKVVSWMSLPRKGQLAVLVFARLAEPLSERSLTSYLFYQLRWFSPHLGPSDIAKQAGYLTAVFAAAQCLTSMWWGRAADNPRLGRKGVLIIGLTGSALSALGMGFSRSLTAAFFFRFCAGALNGNVGVLRTMVSEVVADKRYVKFPINLACSIGSSC
jgi:hypothetical protein